MNGVTFCLVGIPPHTHTDDAKGQRDGVVSTNENRRRPLSSGEVEGLSWKGSRTVFLLKNSQGFGFTLRHFIVYPPDSSLHSLKDEENGNGKARRRRSCLEPMDTIFVKSVKEDGPAQHAGLCTGDRLVKVNGESILGKTYSQVISLIQNSEDILELSIMPKEDDVLQLAYSQDVYLRGNELKTGEAPSHPDAPPLSYSSSKPSSSSPQPAHRFHSPLDNWQCRLSSSTASPLDNRSAPAFSATSGWPGVPKDCSSHSAHPGQHRGRSTSALSALDFHFANHNAAIASATLPPLRKSSLPASARSHTEALCHQALSDWYYSQAEVTERMSPRHRSISQDHLAELGLGSTPSPGPRTSTEQRRRDTLLYHHHTTAASHDSHWLGGWGGQSGPAAGSCSETLLAAYAEYEHNYGRSVETLAQASALVPPHFEHPSQSPQRTKFTDETDQKPSGGLSKTTLTPPVKTPSAVPGGPQSGQQIAEPQTRRVKDDELVGYRSFSPSFTRKAGHELQQTHSFRELGYRGVHLNRSPVTRTDFEDAGREAAPRPKSTPAISAMTVEEGVRYVEDREAVSPVSLHQEVILRQRPPPGRRRRTTTVELPDLSPGTPSPTPTGTGSTRRAHSSLAQHAFDSLSSIPFIGSIKSRRSSYLLAITTERSKSCDEGLNTFREEGRVFSKLPKRVKSFFMDGSLENLRVQEEARSKRHSTSELGDITISDVRKEGWMHYKQILTEKGKKVGGGMRPWKRTFAVLCSHSLFLFKDKREAVLHGAGAGPGQEEHPPISIRGCLTDIAYSETKRKHTLRLTTQDFCEYLLQAEDRDDMLAWIRVIRENSKTDNEEIDFSRQALINKKLNDYRKHSLTGNKADSFPRAHRRMPPFILAKSDNSLVNRGSRCDDNKALWGINIMKKAKKTGGQKAFGVRLEDCQPAINHKFVPLIVEMCCGVVEATGLEYTGIYRVPGNNAMVSNLQEHLNKGLDINTAEERWQDLNVISSLLKSFFRKLPEPLFTDDKYNYFIDANRIEDAEQRLKTMKKLIRDLPNYYYHTLQFLVGHLKKVADSSEKNKMEPRNLALVFGPTLVRTSEDNMTDMVTHMPDRYKIVETLILHCDWFFNDGEFNKEDKTPEDKQDMQPVPNIDHLLSNIGRRGMPGTASDSTTSDSQKSRVSSGSKKDLNTRDFLTKSIISAVTRKRKKSPSSHQQGGSSADEDSEHEPVKASNYQDEGRRGEEEEEEEEGDAGEAERTASRREEHHLNKEEEMKASDSAGGKDLGKDVSEKTGSRSSPAHLDCRSSLLRPQTGYPRTLHPTRGRPSIPFWIRPTRPTSLYQSPSDWSQAAPVRCRKSRSGRTRAVSMNLELSLSDNQRAEPAKEVRVTEETPNQRGDLPTDPLLRLARDFPPLSSTLGWTDRSSPSSSSVVLRRSGQPPPDKGKAWRRHTVVV